MIQTSSPPREVRYRRVAGRIANCEYKPRLVNGGVSRRELPTSRQVLSLADRISRLEARSGLGGRTVMSAALQFDALCEGLAVVELRAPQFLSEDPARTWRDAVAALVAGFKDEPAHRRPRTPTK